MIQGLLASLFRMVLHSTPLPWLLVLLRLSFLYAKCFLLSLLLTSLLYRVYVPHLDRVYDLSFRRSPLYQEAEASLDLTPTYYSLHLSFCIPKLDLPSQSRAFNYTLSLTGEHHKPFLFSSLASHHSTPPWLFRRYLEDALEWLHLLDQDRETVLTQIVSTNLPNQVMRFSQAVVRVSDASVILDDATLLF